VLFTNTVFFLINDSDAKRSNHNSESCDPILSELKDDVENLKEEIQGLPKTSLKKPAEKHKDTLCNKLNAFWNAVCKGDYPDALDKMENDIRAKMDGFLGGNPKNDWVTDPDDQQNLKFLIDIILNADYDNDGLSFRIEISEYGTNPFDADTDADGKDDKWEIDNGFDPTTPDDYGDSDGDGISNADEIALGLDPYSSDSDGDSNNGNFEDGTEMDHWLSLGYDESQAVEFTKKADIDGDGLKDGFEVYLGSNYVYWYEAESTGIRSPGANVVSDQNASDTYNSGNLSASRNSTGFIVNFTHTPSVTPINYFLMAKAKTTNTTGTGTLFYRVNGNVTPSYPPHTIFSLTASLFGNQPILTNDYEWHYLRNMTATGSFNVTLLDPYSNGEILVDKFALVAFNKTIVNTTDDPDDSITFPIGGSSIIVNVSIPFNNQRVPGFVTKATMDLVLKKDPNQNNWPSLVKFDVGNDGIIEWYEPFYTIGSRYPMDFSGALNKFIRSLSNPFTAIAIASVPINISSASAGTIDMNNIEIVVEPNVSDPLDPDTDTDGVLDGNEASAGTGRLDVDSDNDGVFDGLEQTTGGSSAQVTTTDDSDDLLVYTNLNGGSRVVNISLPVSTQNVPGHITSAAMNLTGQIYISGQFPMNVAFDVGNDGVPEYRYPHSNQLKH
jgi:hypothetical protein